MHKEPPSTSKHSLLNPKHARSLQPSSRDRPKNQHQHQHQYQDNNNDYDQDQDSASSSLVHLSQTSSYGQPPSRNTSPFVDLPHPDSWADEDEDTSPDRRTPALTGPAGSGAGVGQGQARGGKYGRATRYGRAGGDYAAEAEQEQDFDQDFDAWDPTSPPPLATSHSQSRTSEDMPSDLRPAVDRSGKQHTPLLAADREQYQDYASPTPPTLRTRRSTFKERDPEVEAQAATRKKYIYAGCFLVISLIAFTVQTETAVYIQHNLKWNKAYCMLYFTHGSWTVLWPVQLAILRLQNWSVPWESFWRRHKQILKQTGQMVQHQTLHVPPHLQKKSPVPYFVRTTAYVTCALTVAGGSWYVAVDLTTASDLTAIYNCSAFFAYAFAIPMLGEKLRWSKVFAVGVAIVGVLVVAYGDAKPNKHGSKSGGGAGGPESPHKDEANNRALGNIIIGVGSVLYGFYEVLYKKVACPPEGCSPGRGMIFANTFGSMIGLFTLLFLWIPIPILHYTGIETFELPRGEAASMLMISVLANATFSGSFLVLMSLTSPVLSSVAALLTIFIVAVVDTFLPPPLNSPLSGAAIVGGGLIIAAFLLLSWATYLEMAEERKKKAEETEVESDIESVI